MNAGPMGVSEPRQPRRAVDNRTGLPKTAGVSSTCAFCRREGVKTRGNHVVPRCKGGREIAPTCPTCEDFIHKTWSHNELRDTYNTVEAIQAADKFKAFLRWLRRQSASVYYRSARGKTRSRKNYT